MQLELPRRIFEISSNTKFHENPSGGSRNVSCGRTDGQMDGRRDTTKLIVAIRNFANAPKNGLPTMKTVRTANKNRENGIFYTELNRTNLTNLGFIGLSSILSTD
jgi:hypothetical protein